MLSVEEDDEFAHGNFDTDSNAQMNATFIATRGADTDIRYNIGLRRRGAGSRNDNPRTMRASIPGDRDWDGNTAMNLNANYSYLQVFGQKLFAASCMAAQQARQVKLLINGVDESLVGEGDLNYGFHAHMEPQGESRRRASSPTTRMGTSTASAGRAPIWPTAAAMSMPTSPTAGQSSRTLRTGIGPTWTDGSSR